MSSTEPSPQHAPQPQCEPSTQSSQPQCQLASAEQPSPTTDDGSIFDECHTVALVTANRELEDKIVELEGQVARLKDDNESWKGRTKWLQEMHDKYLELNQHQAIYIQSLRELNQARKRHTVVLEERNATSEKCNKSLRRIIRRLADVAGYEEFARILNVEELAYDDILGTAKLLDPCSGEDASVQAVQTGGSNVHSPTKADREEPRQAA